MKHRSEGESRPVDGQAPVLVLLEGDEATLLVAESADVQVGSIIAGLCRLATQPDHRRLRRLGWRSWALSASLRNP